MEAFVHRLMDGSLSEDWDEFCISVKWLFTGKLPGDE